VTTIGARPGNTVSILFQGLGMRLANAPIGYCTVALITTSAGRTVLVDTGVHQTREVIETALAARDLAPSDIDCVVLTHLHFDHCENVHLFANAEVIVHEQEIAEAENHPSRDRYLADFWRELLARCQLTVMTDDVLSIDGCVAIRHLPGHRHGQLAVSVATSEGLVVCCSDVAKNARELLSGVPPLSDPDMAEAARTSIEWVRSTADIVVPGHDRVLSMSNGRPAWQNDQDILLTIY
jgi:N-acyl homoserine lactone hydrolase